MSKKAMPGRFLFNLKAGMLTHAKDRTRHQDAGNEVSALQVMGSD